MSSAQTDIPLQGYYAAITDSITAVNADLLDSIATHQTALDKTSFLDGIKTTLDDNMTNANTDVSDRIAVLEDTINTDIDSELITFYEAAFISHSDTKLDALESSLDS
eukprot:CAMPEP_0116890402 /NCGR_PEP_ID=MMETSP0467-20121206/936_1 /TAXON_ID=283647 /ORGANISM="Mesodinium pulex, Strain SPMC105" /LENGTH=107 /DNA_ID=CAMNT_0004558117 /DNA_START=1106 /DNA_END=1429 /DNA_ORIENTATION=+